LFFQLGKSHPRPPPERPLQVSVAGVVPDQPVKGLSSHLVDQKGNKHETLGIGQLGRFLLRREATDKNRKRNQHVRKRSPRQDSETGENPFPCLVDRQPLVEPYGNIHACKRPTYGDMAEFMGKNINNIDPASFDGPRRKKDDDVLPRIGHAYSPGGNSGSAGLGALKRLQGRAEANLCISLKIRPDIGDNPLPDAERCPPQLSRDSLIAIRIANNEVAVFYPEISSTGGYGHDHQEKENKRRHGFRYFKVFQEKAP